MWIKAILWLFLGPKLLDYAYHPNLEHKCKKDILIGRIKNSEDKSWKKIRPRPTKTQYVGPYYICKGRCVIDGLTQMLTFY